MAGLWPASPLIDLFSVENRYASGRGIFRKWKYEARASGRDLFERIVGIDCSGQIETMRRADGTAGGAVVCL